MKKLNLLILSFLCLGIGTGKAQYKDIHDFNGISGAAPLGSLRINGKTMYGMTLDGGLHDSGCVFSIDTNGKRYKDILDFNGVNGAFPEGSLTLFGKRLFGMTQIGGACYKGCIFMIDTDGNGYKDIFDFCGGTNGQNPVGNVTLSGKVLYGMTLYGGLNGMGNIFSIDTDGSGYKDLLDFNDTNGAYPYGSLTFSKGKLFGMTYQGGTINNGCIFSIDTNGNGYRDLLNFNVSDGGLPFGSLILSGSKLFGMTDRNFSDGNIFTIDTDGTGYNVLFNFNGYDGYNPQGDVILIGSNLYGMTLQGGASDSGVVFTVDTNGNNVRVLVDFNNNSYPEGANPVGDLTPSGNVLYGMTKLGGANGYGVIFSYRNLGLGIDNLTSISTSINVSPNPSHGIFTIRFNHSENARPDESFGRVSGVEIYNVMGERVLKQILRSTQPARTGTGGDDKTIDLSGQPNGVYFYRVLREDGSVLGSGKVVVEK